MPLLPEEWIQELLGRLDIREVVERYVPLKERGSRYWACCPFHEEKTPSFSVDPKNGMYYCYGCHKGGTAIQFVSEMERIGFREACERLAEGCGLALPDKAYSRERTAERRKMQVLKEANRAAALFFASELYKPDGKHALEYLKRRGLSDQDIRRNGLGYSPNDWQKTGDTLMKQGFSAAQLEEAGLRKTSRGRSYDLYRGRVMFPIIDGDRSVIGFGGRVMDDSEPKYINTPETLIFNKSRNLYHINVIRQLRSFPYLLLMEGYMDVAGADRFGIRNTVASLGTALTSDQARLLKRYGVPVYISYDGDNAGMKAAERASGILEDAGVACRIVALPNGMDPDEYLRAHGRDAFEDEISRALEPVLFRFLFAKKGLDLEKPDDKERYVQAALRILREVKSAVAKERYARILADETGYSLSAILHDAGSAPEEKHRPMQAAPKRPNPGAGNRSGSYLRKAENYLALYAAVYPERFAKIASMLEEEDFANPANRAIVGCVRDCIARGALIDPQGILGSLDNEEFARHAAGLFVKIGNLESQGRGADDLAKGFAAQLLIARKERENKQASMQYDRCADEEERRELREKMRSLSDEIQKLKSGAGIPAI